MRILGVDPGLERTGFGVIEAQGDEYSLVKAGLIKTSSRRSIHLRLYDIYIQLSEIIIELRPKLLVLEELYSHYKHPRTAIMMGHARGVICLSCIEKDLPIVGYSATRVKKAITGNGRASKDQVRNMIKTLLELDVLPCHNDVTDALALAVSYIFIDERRIKQGL